MSEDVFLGASAGVVLLMFYSAIRGKKFDFDVIIDGVQMVICALMVYLYLFMPNSQHGWIIAGFVMLIVFSLLEEDGLFRFFEMVLSIGGGLAYVLVKLGALKISGFGNLNAGIALVVVLFFIQFFQRMKR